MERGSGSSTGVVGVDTKEKGYTKIYSFPRSFFADFMSPKAQLCDAEMDITIDQYVKILLKQGGLPLKKYSLHPTDNQTRLSLVPTSTTAQSSSSLGGWGGK